MQHWHFFELYIFFTYSIPLSFRRPAIEKFLDETRLFRNGWMMATTRRVRVNRTVSTAYD